MTSGPYVAQPYDADLLAIAGLTGTGYLQRTGANTWSLGSPSSTPTVITVANEATDTTCFVGFFTAATGDLAPKTNTGLTFNSATGAFAVTGNITASGTITIGRTDYENDFLILQNRVGFVDNGYKLKVSSCIVESGSVGYKFSVINNGGSYVDSLAITTAGVAVTGNITASGSVKPGIKTIATLPSAASSTGERYQLSDSATIVNRVVFSNGSAWHYEGTAVAV